MADTLLDLADEYLALSESKMGIAEAVSERQLQMEDLSSTFMASIPGIVFNPIQYSALKDYNARIILRNSLVPLYGHCIHMLRQADALYRHIEQLKQIQ